ncbi:MAG: hypothetical protein ABFC28_04865 [Rikenellaceae bacterium]
MNRNAVKLSIPSSNFYLLSNDEMEKNGREIYNGNLKFVCLGEKIVAGLMKI